MGTIFVGNIVYKAAWKRFENFKRWNTRLCTLVCVIMEQIEQALLRATYF